MDVNYIYSNCLFVTCNKSLIYLKFNSKYHLIELSLVQRT